MQTLKFIVPPYGAEFSDPQRLRAQWRRNGLQIIDSADHLTSTEVICFEEKRHGGIVTCFASALTESRILQLEHGMCARRFPKGMAIGNEDGMKSRDRVQILLPERVPAAAKLLGVKGFKEPNIATTFEHIDSYEHHLLVVPKAQSFGVEELFDTLRMFGLDIELEHRDLLQQFGIGHWFENPRRAMTFLKLSNVRNSYEAFALIQLAILVFEQKRNQLASVHLLADFSPNHPRFREHWTSNR